jgi:hypothetical protein
MSVRFIFLPTKRLMWGESELKFRRMYFKFAGTVTSHEGIIVSVFISMNNGNYRQFSLHL